MEEPSYGTSQRLVGAADATGPRFPRSDPSARTAWSVQPEPEAPRDAPSCAHATRTTAPDEAASAASAEAAASASEVSSLGTESQSTSSGTRFTLEVNSFFQTDSDICEVGSSGNAHESWRINEEVLKKRGSGME